jgi:hypothetical protein
MFAAIHTRIFCLSSAVYKLKDLNIRNPLILPTVLRELETWLRRVPRRIFGRNADEVTGENRVVRDFINGTLRQV